LDAGSAAKHELSFRIPLHRGQTRVVVGDLSQMCERDLAGDDLVIVSDVGARVLAAVLELNTDSHPKLLEVHVASPPIYADPLPDRPSLFFGELPRDHFVVPQTRHVPSQEGYRDRYLLLRSDVCDRGLRLRRLAIDPRTPLGLPGCERLFRFYGLDYRPARTPGRRLVGAWS
jgi:hypothetical protein